MKVMRDYKTTGDLASVNKLLDFAHSLNCPIECFEGSLLDNYIIYADRRIRIGKAKARKYIILREKYVNSWSSITEVILTDNEKRVEEYEKLFNGETE